MHKIIRSLLPRKTVAGALASFQKTLDNLAKVEQDHTDEMKRHSATIYDAQVAHGASSREAAAARKVHGQIAAIIGA